MPGAILGVENARANNTIDEVFAFTEVVREKQTDN